MTRIYGMIMQTNGVVKLMCQVRVNVDVYAVDGLRVYSRVRLEFALAT